MEGRGKGEIVARCMTWWSSSWVAGWECPVLYHGMAEADQPRDVPALTEELADSGKTRRPACAGNISHLSDSGNPPLPSARHLVLLTSLSLSTPNFTMPNRVSCWLARPLRAQPLTVQFQAPPLEIS
jgi:hypothetical protein